MKCPKCNAEMDIDFELIDPPTVYYICPECGHKCYKSK